MIRVQDRKQDGILFADSMFLYLFAMRKSEIPDFFIGIILALYPIDHRELILQAGV
jgi:hypothetical protein